MDIIVIRLHHVLHCHLQKFENMCMGIYICIGLFLAICMETNMNKQAKSIELCYFWHFIMVSFKMINLNIDIVDHMQQRG